MDDTVDALVDPLDLDFGSLDITTDEVSFDEIDGDLERFQKDEVVRAALDKGVDLRHYSRQIESDLRVVELASINDYVHEADHIAQLFQQVTQCESILSTMQDMLQGFRSNLGGISQEIKTLQNDSLTMNIKLRNRRAVSSKVTLFLDKVAVSEDMIDVICDGDVGPVYVEHLRSLSEKLKYTSGMDAMGRRMSRPTTPSSVYSSGAASGAGVGAGAGAGAGVGAGLGGSSTTYSETGGSSVLGGSDAGGSGVEDEEEEEEDLGVSPSETLAGRDALPELDRLRLKAVTRIREFLLLRIAELRQPKTNVQKLQEYVLLKHQYLMEFLSDHAPQLAAEVRQEYITSMGRLLANMFKAYHNCLAKLETTVASKADLIVVEQNPVRSLFGSRVDLTKRTDVFCLGARAKVLEQANDPPLHIHVAQAEKTKYPYESLFRSLQKHLMDAATAEYSFTSRFFTSGVAGDVFLRVFAKSISQVLESLEDYLCQSYDPVGLLLMIHITHSHRTFLESKSISCLDSYFNRVTMLLWPRFKSVFDLNLTSIRTVNIRKLGTVDLKPHYITSRYAEFASSVLTLHRSLEASGDEMLHHHLSILRTELMRLLQKLGETFHANRKERTVFLINNLVQISAIMRERHLPPADFESLQESQGRQVGVYVEQELASHFFPLIDFVKKTEAETHAMARATASVGSGAGAGAASGSVSSPESTSEGSSLPKGVTPRADRAVVETLVRDFSRVWEGSIAAIHGSTVHYFGPHAMEILKQVLTQLLLYFSRFKAIVTALNWSDLERSLPSVAAIFAHIKTFSGAGL